MITGVTMAGQMDLFFESASGERRNPTGLWTRMKVIVTVKAAPQPSAHYGETVCVAGVSADLEDPRWVRLYPINFRELERNTSFRKYDLMSLEVRKAANDARRESWRPRVDSIQVESSLPDWRRRKPWIDPYVGGSMCQLGRAAQADPGAPSLGLVRPREVRDLIVRPHPGWRPEEQAKIDGYVNQLDLFDQQDRSPLEAPRMQGWYLWLCRDSKCTGHRQMILDWEFVALQRRLRHLDDATMTRELRERFLIQICRPSNDVAFFVGNQAKRHQTFSVLGIYYPPL